MSNATPITKWNITCKMKAIGLGWLQSLFVALVVLSWVMVVSSFDIEAAAQRTKSSMENNIYLPLVMWRWPPAPSAPVLKLIKNPEGDGSYRVNWNVVERATSYNLEEDDTPTFSSPTVVYSGAGVSMLIRDRQVGTYYYRVKASNIVGDSPWSAEEAVEVNRPGTIAAVWPMMGRDPAHTNNSPFSAPTNPKAVWSIDIPVGYATIFYKDEIVVGGDGTVYVTAGAGVYSVNPDGSMKWAKWDGDDINPKAIALGHGSTTLYAYDMNDGELYALDPENGDEIWVHSFGIQLKESSPLTVGPDEVIYFTQLDYMNAVNPDGTLKWSWHYPDWPFPSYAAPTLNLNGDVYGVWSLGHLNAIGVNGDYKWDTFHGSSEDPHPCCWSAPSVGPDGTIYWGNNTFRFEAVNPDGTLKWRIEVEAWVDNSTSAISSDGSTIFNGDNNGNYYAFSNLGKIKWQYQLPDCNDIPSIPALAVNDVVMYFISPTLLALRASDGSLLWTYPASSLSYPVIAPGGRIYILEANPIKRTLHALQD